MTNIGPQTRLTERRQAFYNAIANGNPLRDTVETFAKEYGVSESALYGDWEKRYEDWENVIPPVDTAANVRDALARLDELRAKLWDKALTAEKDSDQIKAWGKLIDSEQKTIEMNMKLGRVQQFNHLLNPTFVWFLQQVAESVEDLPEARLRIDGLMEEIKKVEAAREQREEDEYQI
jgi:hypothetical protein